MSLLNLAISPDASRALVSSDTIAVAPDGRRYHVTKLLALPHLHAVLGGRGAYFVILHVMGTACGAQSIEEAYEVMPKALTVAKAQAYQAADPALREEIDNTTIALVATQRTGNVVARVWGGFNGAACPVWEVPPGNAYLGPYYEELHDIKPLTRQEHERVARIQVAAALKAKPDAPIGGRLIVARIDGLDIGLREVCQLTNEEVSAWL
jgi:hypothetical protein